MKNDILIHVVGGNIQSVFTHNPDLKVIIVDEDRFDVGENPVFEEKPEVLETNGFEYLFAGSNSREQEIHDELKKLNQ